MIKNGLTQGIVYSSVCCVNVQSEHLFPCPRLVTISDVKSYKIWDGYLASLQTSELQPGSIIEKIPLKPVKIQGRKGLRSTSASTKPIRDTSSVLKRSPIPVLT